MNLLYKTAENCFLPHCKKCFFLNKWRPRKILTWNGEEIILLPNNFGSLWEMLCTKRTFNCSRHVCVQWVSQSFISLVISFAAVDFSFFCLVQANHFPRWIVICHWMSRVKLKTGFLTPGSSLNYTKFVRITFILENKIHETSKSHSPFWKVFFSFLGKCFAQVYPFSVSKIGEVFVFGTIQGLGHKKPPWHMREGACKWTSPGHRSESGKRTSGLSIHCWSPFYCKFLYKYI